MADTPTRNFNLAEMEEVFVASHHLQHLDSSDLKSMLEHKKSWREKNGFPSHKNALKNLIAAESHRFKDISMENLLLMADLRCVDPPKEENKSLRWRCIEIIQALPK